MSEVELSNTLASPQPLAEALARHAGIGERLCEDCDPTVFG